MTRSSFPPSTSRPPPSLFSGPAESPSSARSTLAPSALTPRTSRNGLRPRHAPFCPYTLNGLSAAMDELVDVAERCATPGRSIRVIGDAARACGGGYKDGKIGKAGWANVFSFHTMKLMSTLGEGGMITTDDADLVRQLRGIRQWGGESEGWGSSYKLTKVQAAVGSVQLRRLDEMLSLRAQRARERIALLEGLPHLAIAPRAAGMHPHLLPLHPSRASRMGGRKAGPPDRNPPRRLSHRLHGRECTCLGRASPPASGRRGTDREPARHGRHRSEALLRRDCIHR